MENVVQAFELLGFFHRDQVAGLFDDADLVLFPLEIAAHGTERAVAVLGNEFAETEALRAQPYLLAQFPDAVGQAGDVVQVALQQVKRQARRALLPDAGKLRQLLNQTGQRRGVSTHFGFWSAGPLADFGFKSKLFTASALES